MSFGCFGPRQSRMKWHGGGLGNTTWNVLRLLHIGSSRRWDRRVVSRWDSRLATRAKRLFGLTLGGPWCCSGNTCRRRNRAFRRLSRAAWAHVRQSARRCVGAGYATHIKTFESCLGLLAQLAPLRGLYPMSTAVENFFFALPLAAASAPPLLSPRSAQAAHDVRPFLSGTGLFSHHRYRVAYFPPAFAFFELTAGGNQRDAPCSS